MARLGVGAYRFSLSWPRILPGGSGTPHPEGLRFYSNLIDELLQNGIAPWVTLHHWDLPLSLQLEEDGWLNPRLAERFRDYAAVCFEHFGDRVKHWMTFNEPWVISILGYGQGVFPPGRTSMEEPYRAAHNLLRAHGMAVDVYRRRFQATQKGMIGMANNCDWREPRTNSPEDRAAAERALEFFLGWFADPLYRGDYPDVMRERVRERLPEFAPEDRERILGSADFFGLNHYTTMYAEHARAGALQAANPFGNGGITEDQDVNLSMDPRWPRTTMQWSIVPWGCRKLLHWIHDRYGAPEIYVTENGCSTDDHPVNGIVDDAPRIEFLRQYLVECHTALGEGVKLKGYFVWSLLDNFEWIFGYTRRFGLHYVEYATGERIAKTSSRWYAEVVRNNAL
jgi:beta-glucosidase